MIRSAARRATTLTLITLAVLSAIAALVSCSPPAHAYDSALCYLGSYQQSYAVMSEPTVCGGAIEIQADTGSWVRLTIPCLVDLDPLPATLADPVGVSQSVVYCYDPHTGAELLRHGTAALAVIDDGIMRWTEVQSGRRYLSSLPCREYRYSQ